MKYYTYPKAPNPLRVGHLLKYKGIEVETVFVDIGTGAHMQPPFSDINTRLTLPALETDDGTVLTEVIAITQYLDSVYPDKPLFGSNDLERAQIVDWMHRIFLDGILAVGEALRNSSPGMKHRALPGSVNIEQIPELAERGLNRLPTFFSNLDAHLADRDFIVGNSLSQADIDAFVAVAFSGWVKVQPSEELKQLAAWKERVAALV